MTQPEQNADQYLCTIAQQRWSRLLEAPQLSGADSAFAQIKQVPQLRPEWSQVWGGSEFVAGYCTAHPEILCDLLASDLDSPGNARSIAAQVKAATADCTDEAALHRALRRLRMRAMVRIAWRDLGGLSELEETMECVSALADECIQTALQFHQAALQLRYGVPCNADGRPAHFVVLGLGKLGGRELNYSSDVDLMFAYTDGGVTRSEHAHEHEDEPAAAAKSIDNQQFFTKLARKLVAALDPVTADGFVFRTDLRLRPNGDSGPVVLSFAAIEHYYQTHGRTWERYALIKARIIAGDADCGQALLQMLRPFIYRKYLDFGAFDSIRSMKRKVEREMKQHDTHNNIKLGWGGIREVEFLVQSYQLIRGGREQSLRTVSLYAAMQALVDLEVFKADEADRLKQSYRFLRNTEHRLQMVADRQTQMLPESAEARQTLAGGMRFDDWATFDAELQRQREYVHARFRCILDDAAPTDGAVEETIRAIYDGNMQPDNAIKLLQNSEFQNPEALPGLLKEFHESRLYKSCAHIERDRLDRLLPLALMQAKQCANASRSMAAFISIIEAIGHRTAYFSLLIENPFALSQLLKLCSASPWLSAHIGRNPVVLDQLLHPIEDARDHSSEYLTQQLQHRIAQIDADDEEARMNLLREFQHAQVLQIAAADISGSMQVEQVHAALVALAETLIGEVFNDAIAFTSRKLDKPTGEAGVIAYGKFAGGELGYHSDLDIVVCFRAPQEQVEPHSQQREYYWSRMGRRFIHLLTTRTGAGILYPIDMRLRPSGRSGTLVTSLDGFFQYQHEHAWTWEHQALVRARVVAGGDDFRCRFEEDRRAILCLPRDHDQLQQDIGTMREKMIAANCQSTDTKYDLKLDQGGIVDIEFLVQYWVLRFAHEHDPLTIPRGNSDILHAVAELGLVQQEVCDRLRQCYRRYLQRSLQLKLQDLPVLAEQDELLEEREFVISVWDSVFSATASANK